MATLLGCVCRVFHWSLTPRFCKAGFLEIETQGLPVFHSQHWDDKSLPTCLTFTSVLGTELRSSGLNSQHFTDRASPQSRDTHVLTKQSSTGKGHRDMPLIPKAWDLPEINAEGCSKAHPPASVFWVFSSEMCNYLSSLEILKKETLNSSLSKSNSRQHCP